MKREMTNFERTLFIHSIPLDTPKEEILECCINRIEDALEVLKALFENERNKY